MPIRNLTLLVFAASAPTVWAHGQGSLTHDAGLIAGLLHPLSGLDHLLAMVAVGLWAARQGGHAQWVLPFSFVGAMAAGGALGLTGAAIVGLETGIALSVLVLGWLVAMRSRVQLPLAASLCGLFALFHGLAHAQEMPLAASPFAYALGMLTATALLHVLGVYAGRKVRQRLLGFTGSAISLAGAGMLFSLVG